ncbi:unnamed protein product [Schistosoma rodhaini]|nr:unnamed protein product [Schistosoma rodhaini]
MFRTNLNRSTSCTFLSVDLDSDLRLIDMLQLNRMGILTVCLAQLPITHHIIGAYTCQLLFLNQMSLELSVMDPYRKITNFLNFQKIQSNSFNREPIRLKSLFYKESLIHVVVECRKISSQVNSYVLFEIAVYDNQLNEIWRRALYQVLLDEVDVNFKSVPISLSFDLTCGLVYPRVCGVIFVGFPTNKVVGFALVQSLRISLLIPLIISLTVSFFVFTWCCDLDATNS